MGIEPLGALERMPMVVESRTWLLPTTASDGFGTEDADTATDIAD
jgi:hypothetical protein